MFFKKLVEGLKKTREKLSDGLRGLFGMRRDLDDRFIEELEEVLYQSDMGTTANTIIDSLRTAYRQREVKTTADVYELLKRRLRELLTSSSNALRTAERPPTVILVVGVNGSGKTTSIAKLAHHLKSQGKSVVLGACDTFRAAAIEQLTLWSQRIGVPIVKGPHGADPAAVAFDAAEQAVKQNADWLIVDTAGRLHTQVNLMKELDKIKRVIAKKIPGAPHEVLLVLDATTGQNAVNQALQFKEVVDVSGLFLAKLDGTAKGGAVIAIRHRVDIPVKFIGVGEKPDDIEAFDADEFVKALFE